jgi:nuclear pore complex protein Nup107
MILTSKVHSNDIIAHKTQALLGQRYDSFDALESEADEDLTDILDGSAVRKRQLKAFMLGEAKNYRDLEALISTLDNIETANSLDTLMRE